MKIRKTVPLILVGLVVCIFVFAGCGSVEDKPEKNDAKYPVVVENNKYFKFEVTGIDDFWGSHECKITNKTKKDIIFSIDKAVVNGNNTVDAFIYSDIAAGTSAKETLDLNADQFSDYKAGEKIRMAMKYEISDNNSYKTMKKGTFNYEFIKQE